MGRVETDMRMNLMCHSTGCGLPRIQSKQGGRVRITGSKHEAFVVRTR